MSHQVVEFDQRCKTCEGTGLHAAWVAWVPMKAAIVCPACKGAGHYLTKIEYDDFEGLEERAGIERVFEANIGISLGTDRQLSGLGGLPYRIWWNNYASQGKPFPPGTENRNCTCPAWWYQNVDYDRKPRWGECSNVVDFGTCRFFSEKDGCWKRWDRIRGMVENVLAQDEALERSVDF